MVNDDRHAVEFCRFDPAERRIRWQGCAILSPHAEPRAIATLPDGGLLVSSFNDALDPERLERMARAEPTGSVFEWHGGRGFTPAKGLSAAPDANGLEISADGRGPTSPPGPPARRWWSIARAARRAPSPSLSFRTRSTPSPTAPCW